ncbi:ROK family transcriptional regulator [Nocardioides kribbensis]
MQVLDIFGRSRHGGAVTERGRPRAESARPSGNARALTGLLAARGPMSRADLARAAGLSRSAVSNLVLALLADGAVVETAQRGRPHKGGSGRPPVLVALSVPDGCVAGVDVGHAHVRVALADRSGTVLVEEQAGTQADLDGPQTLDLCADMVRSALRAAGRERSELAAVGLCVPAPVDRRSARISTGILPGWRGLVPSEELGRRLDVEVHADNDANLGALAESRHGAARDRGDLVYVKLSTGVGAGIVLGGRLHRGATGLAGEIGHVQVGEDGHVCRCGNRGCLETLVALPHLLAVLQPAYDETLTTERLRALDEAGDPAVRRVLTDAGRTLGRALADLGNSLNPATVVVGGALGACGSVVAGVRDAIDRYAQPATAAALEVRPGHLGDRAEVVGALTLAVLRTAAAGPAG